MAVSYKKLWKILIDKDMKKQDLQKATGVSWGVITKLSKGETVSMEVLIKLCKCLDCSIDDMLDILPDETDSGKATEQS
ncbi:MAG: helix-turn-helix transcriptional regulator [Gracilibacteraceae bacterium]|nr:helix-turn-helix transcriptional regulator [Gracilibacteraceae bacterium]